MYMIYSAFLGNRFNVCAECTGSFFFTSPLLGIADRKAAAALFTRAKTINTITSVRTGVPGQKEK